MVVCTSHSMLPCATSYLSPQGRQLSLLSKDFNRADIAATQFLINGCAPLPCLLVLHSQHLHANLRALLKSRALPAPAGRRCTWRLLTLRARCAC